MLRTTIMFTTAPARTGKTWYRASYWLLNDFLPNSDGVHISNFPIEFEPWKDAAGRDQPGLVELARLRGIDEATIRTRVQTIPADVVKGWRNEGWRINQGRPDGPWNYFRDLDISGAHIAIDECHNFCGEFKVKQIRDSWGEWLGEIGHSGATVEFISQHPDKVAQAVINEAEIKLQLTGSTHELHPYLRIKYYYLDSFLAKCGLGWNPKLWVREKRKAAEKWVKHEEDRVLRIEPAYFGAYNSFNQPIGGGRAGSLGLPEWQRMAWPRFLAWFMSGCALQLAKTFGLWALIAFIIFGGRWFVPICTQVLPLWFAGSLGGAGEGKRASVASNGPRVVATAPGEAVKLAGVSSELTPAEVERIAALVDQVRQLNADLENEKVIVSEMQLERDALADRLNAAFAVAALQPDVVTFRAGYSYSVGDLIDWGPYEGRKVKAIDYARRIVELDDGRKLRMGVSGDSDFAKWLLSLREKRSDAGSGSGSDVRGSLPSAAGAKPGASTLERVGRAAADVVR